jgi:plastocyanin
MKKAAIIIGILIVMGVGAWFLFLKDDSTPSTTRDNTNTPPTIATDNVKAAATITYTSNGFEPATTTIKSGQTIEIMNKSNRLLQLDSDPHPAHTDDPELNVGSVANGDSQKFTLRTKGMWGFHNHLNPSDTGKVDVQ